MIANTTAVFARAVVPALFGYALTISVIVWGARHPQPRVRGSARTQAGVEVFLGYALRSLIAAYALLLVTIAVYSVLILREGWGTVISVAWSVPFLAAVGLGATVPSWLLTRRRHRILERRNGADRRPDG